MYDPNLAQTSFQHVSGFLVGVTDALKFKSTFDYDASGRLITITNPLGISQSRQYAENGELTYTINKNGNGIEYQYTDGMPTSAFVITDETNVDRIEYDSLGRMTKSIDPDGNFAKLTYDNRGNIVAQENAEGEIVRSTYDHRNRLVSKEDPRGGLTTYVYDYNDNLTSITNQLGETTKFFYDPEDQLQFTLNPDEYATARYEYDAAGRVTRETIGSDTFSYFYDAMGNRIRVIGNNGVTISETEYDASNRPISVTDARGQTTRFEYDLLGQQVKRLEPQLVGEGQSPEGNPITFKFDGMNRIESVTDKLGRTLKKTFEDDDVVKELVNAAGQKTTFSYTDRNLLAGITTPGNFTTRFEYTGSGFLHRYIPPTANRTQEYSYDLAGRLVRTRHVGTATPDILYDYDASGNRIRVSTLPVGTGMLEVKIAREFDVVNRLTSNRDAANQSVTYAYNIVGQVSEITYPDGKKVKYTYDGEGRIETVTDWADRVTRYTWGEGDQVMLIRFPNGTVRVMEYSDNLFLLSRADYDADGAVIVRYAYSYDINGFISVEQVEGPPPTDYAPADVSYAYDAGNRLINISGVNVGYDDDGNVVIGPVGGQPTAMTWDQRNNLSKVGAVVLRYDPEDRLVGWTDGPETVQLAVVEASDGSMVMVSTSSAGPTTRYVYGVGLVYEETDGKIKVHHYDERGNTTAFSDGSGKVSGRLAYSPYGEVIAESGDSSSLFQYGGLFGVVAAPDGLNYMRFRWYSPEMKRFISMDSSLGDITLPFSLNRYIYAGSNPINFNDPEGEWVNIVVGAVGGAILGATVEIVSSKLQGKPVNWNSVASAAIGGAFAGGFAAAGGIGFSAFGGAVGSFSEDVSRAALNGQQVSAGKVLLGAVVGAAGGAAGAKFGGFLKNQWSKSVALDAKLSGNFSKPLVDRLTNSAFKKAVKYEATKNALKFSPRLASDYLEDQVDFSAPFFPDSAGSAPDVSTPPGRVGAIIGGATQMPTSNVGQGGEYLHYQRYLDALSAADRPLPNPPENLTSF
jgi:RHS repeat-associated protein